MLLSIWIINKSTVTHSTMHACISPTLVWEYIIIVSQLFASYCFILLLMLTVSFLVDLRFTNLSSLYPFLVGFLFVSSWIDYFGIEALCNYIILRVFKDSFHCWCFVSDSFFCDVFCKLTMSWFILGAFWESSCHYWRNFLIPCLFLAVCLLCSLIKVLDS
jgi:hypothetical protein